MPYSHFHNWSFHTHHRRPKGGNHYNATRRRQRPWRIGFRPAAAALVVVACATLAMRYDWFGEPAELTAIPSPTSKSSQTPALAADKAEAPENTRVTENEERQELLEHEIVTLINVERSRRRIGTLTWDPRLQAIARAHSRDMAAKNYFSHTNRAGLDYRERAAAAGYICPNPKWQGVAENLFFGTRGHQRPQDAVDSWLDSPLHRRAMLDATFSRAAIGIHEGHLSGYGRGYYTTLLLC